MRVLCVRARVRFVSSATNVNNEYFINRYRYKLQIQIYFVFNLTIFLWANILKTRYNSFNISLSSHKVGWWMCIFSVIIVCALCARCAPHYYRPFFIPLLLYSNVCERSKLNLPVTLFFSIFAVLLLCGVVVVLCWLKCYYLVSFSLYRVCVFVFECSFLMNCVPHSIKCFFWCGSFFPVSFVGVVAAAAAVEGATEYKYNTIFSNTKNQCGYNNNLRHDVLFLLENACCCSIV